MLREAASPLCSRDSPSASTTWSAAAAAASAAPKPALEPHSSSGMLPAGSVCFISHARVNVVFGFCSLMPL